MAHTSWQELLPSLTILRGQPRPISDAELDQFERETAFTLPKSYRAFCTSFGPGELVRPWHYRIAVPGPSDWSEMVELRKFNRYAHTCTAECDEYCANPDQVRRAWCFGTDIGASWYFWDPLDVTEPSGNEYGIYILYRGYKIGRLAGTFWSFVNDVCLGSGVPGYDNTEPMARTFEPAVDLG
jgi:hypothetical protein